MSFGVAHPKADECADENLLIEKDQKGYHNIRVSSRSTHSTSMYGFDIPAIMECVIQHFLCEAKAFPKFAIFILIA